MAQSKIDTLALSKKGWLIVGKKDSGRLQCKLCKKVHNTPVEDYSDGNLPEACKCRKNRLGTFCFISF